MELFLVAILLVAPFPLAVMSFRRWPTEAGGTPSALGCALLFTGLLGIVLVLAFVSLLSNCFWKSSEECSRQESGMFVLLTFYGLSWLACLLVWLGIFIRAKGKARGQA